MFKVIDATILYMLSRPLKDAGVTIRDVISFVDYLDHSIPEYNELEESLRRLSDIGLVTCNHSVIYATSAYVKWSAGHLKKAKKVSLQKEINEINIHLATSFSFEEILTPKLLTESEFEEAVIAYKAGFTA